MQFSQETIIGFLTGTVATIIIKAIIDSIQKRTEFKRELKKLVYTKKLDAAEHAVKAMYQNIQSSITIINAIDNLLNRDMDGELFDSIWTSYFDLIEKSESNLLNSTASMYFDIHDAELWNNDDQKLLLETYSRIKILGEEIQIYEDELEKLEEGKGFEEFDNHIETELRDPLRSELKILIELLQKNSNALFQTIELIKSEFHK